MLLACTEACVPPRGYFLPYGNLGLPLGRHGSKDLRKGTVLHFHKKQACIKNKMGKCAAELCGRNATYLVPSRYAGALSGGSHWWMRRFAHISLYTAVFQPQLYASYSSICPFVPTMGSVVGTKRGAKSRMPDHRLTK
jgi:hypothetical protein